MKRQIITQSIFRAAFLLLYMVSPGKSTAQPALRFEHIGYEDGLSQQTVTVILQDRSGFMWFGTYDGLNRYDGYELKQFRSIPGDTTSLRHNSVWALCEDQDGSIWIGTSAGLSRYDPLKDAFVRYFHDPQNDSSLSHNSIWALQLDDSGNLWVGTSDGLNRYDRENDSFIRYKSHPDDPESLAGNIISKIYKDPDQTLWFQTNNGLNKYIAAKNDFVRYAYHPDDLKSIAYMNSSIFEGMVQDSNGLMWIANRKGLFHFDPDQEDSRFKQYQFEPDNPYSISDDNITALFIDSKNNLWVGTDGGGLNLFDRERDRFFRYVHDENDPNSLSDDVITDIFEDEDGSLWIGTHFGGVNFLSHQTGTFRNYRPSPEDHKGPSHKTLVDILETEEGNLWLTTKAGLNFFDRKANSFHYYQHDPNYPNSLSDDEVGALMKDHTGLLWIGTLNGGLNTFDPVHQKITRYLPDEQDPFAVSNYWINYLLEDLDDNVWIAGGNGLDLYNREKGRFIPYTDEKYWISTVYQDSHDLIWVGTTWRGIKRVEKGKSKFISYSNIGRDNAWLEDSKKEFWVASPNGVYRYDRQRDTFLLYLAKETEWFFEDSQKRLWIGTPDGIELLDTKNRASRVYLKMEDIPGGLRFPGHNKMVEDDIGNFWIGCRGLVKYNPQSKKLLYFDKRDGLISNSLSMGKKLSTGEILFTADNGFVIFHPDSLEENTHIPNVVLTDFRLFNKTLPIRGSAKDTLDFASPLIRPITFTEEIVMQYWQNDFSLEFAALNYTSPEKNQYAFRLEGYPEDWSYTDAGMRIAKYTNLSPGTYTFRVRGSNNDRKWNKEGVSLKIVIRPPWWRTWWSYSMYALIILGVLYSYYHFQLKRRLAQAETYRLRELDQVKTRLYTNITHEFRTPLTVISGMVIQMANDPQRWFREGIAMIRRNTESLLGLVNQMLDLSKLESRSMPLRLQQAEVEPYLKYLSQSFEAYAASKGIMIHFHSKIDGLIMDFDPEKLTRIVRNLVSNAIKFTPENGHIYFTAGSDHEELILEIRDTGIGIPEGQLPYIFDRFYQVHDWHTRKGEGTGIGLALTRELVHLMKGRISVNSKIREGSEFTVRLPITHEAPPAQLSVSEPSGSPLAEPGSSLEVPSVLSGEDPDLPTALIVEDHKEVARYIASCLEGRYHLELAFDGQEGIDRAIELVPDIIISDVMMPERDGYELTATLKKDERTSHIPILLLTAKGDIDSKIEGLELGADAYLYKPFEPKELEVRIRKLIELRQNLRERFSALNTPGATEDVTLQKEAAFLQKLRKVVEDNIKDETLGVSQLVQAMGVSRTQLHRKLKALTGKSTSQVVRSIKLQKAKLLLQDSDLNISEVAFAVGFKSLAYFSASFSEEYGMTPSEARK